MARQRRHKTRRRRRGRFRGLYSLLSVLLVAAAVIGASVVFFRVNEVTVEGNSRYTDQEVVEASGIRTGDNLVGLSKSEIAGKIRTGLPYVESVSVHRKFPDGVELTVRERLAVASVTSSSGRWLISSQGKLLEQHSGQRVVEIRGFGAISPYAGGSLQVREEDSATLSYVLELLTALEKRELLSKCTVLDCTSDTYLTLNYDIYVLKLPRGCDYDYKLRLLLNALGHENMPQGVPGTFDFTIDEKSVNFRPQH